MPEQQTQELVAQAQTVQAQVAIIDAGVQVQYPWIASQRAQKGQLPP
jgi:hypothetical protein